MSHSTRHTHTGLSSLKDASKPFSKPVFKHLREGMRAGDLADLLLPLISVDEYVSTVDKNAVTIGFYVHDQDAANDLNRFLQKSSVSILSSEVSPAPDQHGYFLVFIELMDNEGLTKNLEDILQEIEPLCDIDNWKMHVRKTDGAVPFTAKNFSQALQRARATDEEKVLEFLTPSLLSDASIVNGNLHIETATGQQRDYRVVAFAPITDIAKKYKIFEKALGISIPQVVRSIQVTTMLGEGWLVNEIDDYILLQHECTNHCLLLSESV